MRAAMHNRGRTIAPPGTVRDAPRLNAQHGRGPWAKMSYKHRTLNGKVIEIHYYMNLKFKFW